MKILIATRCTGLLALLMAINVGAEAPAPAPAVNPASTFDAELAPHQDGVPAGITPAPSTAIGTARPKALQLG